jgi:hypothetical protein
VIRVLAGLEDSQGAAAVHDGAHRRLHCEEVIVVVIEVLREAVVVVLHLILVAAPSAATPTIKLLIAKDAGVVVLAEAGKLTAKEKDSPLGALANLHASVQRMDPGYMQSPETRDALLNPAPAHPALVAAAGGFPSLVQPPAPPPAPAPPPGPSKASSSPCLALKGLALPPFSVVAGACS